MSNKCTQRRNFTPFDKFKSLKYHFGITEREPSISVDTPILSYNEVGLSDEDLSERHLQYWFPLLRAYPSNRVIDSSRSFWILKRTITINLPAPSVSSRLTVYLKNLEDVKLDRDDFGDSVLVSNPLCTVFSLDHYVGVHWNGSRGPSPSGWVVTVHC